MAGRAKIKIDAKELSVYQSLVNELEQKGHTISDNSQITITFLAPYKSRPAADLNLIYGRLNRYISINGNKVVTKKELTKILRISRPTLDEWINKGWLDVKSARHPCLRNGKDYEIDLIDIKSQLSKMTLHLKVLINNNK